MTVLERQLFVLVVFFLVTAAAASVARGAQGQPLQGVTIDARRVDAVAAMLPDRTFAFGPQIDDRAAWRRIAATKPYANIVKDAEALLSEPMPAMSEDVYGEYHRTGERTKRYFDTRKARHSRIQTYALAECVENKGRFVRPLEDVIASVCDEPTWIYPFHDEKQDNWNGRIVGIDLGSVLPAHDMAQVEHQMGGRLSNGMRDRMRREVRRRILEPYRRVVEGEDEVWRWWIISEANWNAVCHFGVVGSALVFGHDARERAWYVASAETYLRNFIKGFGPDGYCAEGMDYWSYGFGNYVHLAELVQQATGGKVDWFADPAVKLIATYPPRLEIRSGVWPAYADCKLQARPGTHLMAFLNRRYQLGLAGYRMADFSTTSWGLPGAMLYTNPNSATAAPAITGASGFDEIRSFFPHGGVLTCRPARGSGARLAASIKGGHNDEPHNHNDLGTFVVVLDDQPILLDPGGEVYTARTFGKERYASNLLNSYGHPVPVVAGKLQSAGKPFAARIVATDFTDAADRLTLDLKGAYDVAELRTLQRTFTYGRAGAGSFTVRDDFAFASPQSFATSLITFGDWRRTNDGELIVWQNGKALKVTVDAGAAPVEIAAEKIDEKIASGGDARPTRIGINLARPAERGSLTLTITPTDAPPRAAR